MPSNPSPVALTIRDRIQREYDQKMRENTRYLMAIFYFWLCLLLYIALDSGFTHIPGFLVLTVLGVLLSLAFFSVLDCCGVTV